MYKLYTGPKAQNFPDADNPGSYKLASKISDNTFNAGDSIQLEQYITGYGNCSGIKIVCYISGHIFDEANSVIKTGVTVFAGSEKLQWGAGQFNLSNGGISFTLPSRKTENWDKPSSVYDIKENLNYIITERNLPAAPLSYDLKLKKNVKPGNHFLSFYMTYFNGWEWVCQEEKIQFKVNNTFEKYNTIISALAAIALVVTIFHDGAYPILEAIHDLGKFTSQIHGHK